MHRTSFSLLCILIWSAFVSILEARGSFNDGVSGTGTRIMKRDDLHRQLDTSAAKMKTILCIGDSITYGSGASNVETTSYPALLQGQLHKYISEHYKRSNIQNKPLENYTIVNLGQKGAAATKSSNNPFWRTNQFASLSTFKDVSIVVFNLGANDAQNANNFNQEAFTTDYLELVSILHKLDGHPIVFICIPTVILPRYASTKCNATVINWVYPHIIPKIAAKSDSKLIDLYTAIGGSVSLDIWKVGNAETVTRFTNDGLHPNDRGYALIADKVAQEIWKYLI